jgi:hypothetical protein
MDRLFMWQMEKNVFVQANIYVIHDFFLITLFKWFNFDILIPYMPICDEKKENHYSLLCAQILRHSMKSKKKQVLLIRFNNLENSNSESFI